jgi:hypothetical protein
MSSVEEDGGGNQVKGGEEIALGLIVAGGDGAGIVTVTYKEKEACNWGGFSCGGEPHDQAVTPLS